MVALGGNLALSIETSDIGQAETLALFRAGHELMDRLIVDRSQSKFSINSLSAANVCLLIARSERVAVGCCAVISYSCYGELKRMYVSPNARGNGVASQLLQHAEQLVLEKGHKMLRLESATVLTKAHELYDRHGFSFCRAFGNHKEDPRSVFMEKIL